MKKIGAGIVVLSQQSSDDIAWFDRHKASLCLVLPFSIGGKYADAEHFIREEKWRPEFDLNRSAEYYSLQYVADPRRFGPEYEGSSWYYYVREAA